jgi:predicted DNA-binding transcriptional regulator AlpA
MGEGKGRQRPGRLDGGVRMKTKRKGARGEPTVEAKPIRVPTGLEVLLSRGAIAAALDVSVRHLDGMIAAGNYPRPDTHLGKLPRWHRETHDAWVRRRVGKET